MQTIAQTFWAFTILFGAVVVGRADVPDNESAAPSANRWAFFIDASNDASDENYAALLEFRNALIKSGIPEENAPIYSASSDDLQKRPTRDTINAIVDALRRPDFQVVLPGNAKGIRLREDGGVCEVQIYLTGLGVANEETGRVFFAPSDVDESQIKDCDDPRLIPLETLEDALLFAKDSQKPVERTFFVVALNSPKSDLRDSFETNASRLKGVAPNQIPTRGKKDADDSSRFAYFRVATKNARFDDKTVGSFYQTLRDGLAGSADVAGNQNGTVDAAELASYLETTARLAGNAVAVVQSGNYEYPLCRSQKKPSIPDGIFDKLAKTFDDPAYARERKFAERKAKIRNALKKKNDASKKGTNAK